jgi:hypothetical protein
MHLRVSIGNDLLHLSSMLDFEGTVTPGKCNLNFLWHFAKDFFLIQVSTVKTLCIKLHGTVMNKTNICYNFATQICDR